MGTLKLGTISLDGTKIKTSASKHKALSWKYANQLESQLKKEVEDLMRLAEQSDNSELAEALDIPAELERRESRLKSIDWARQKIEARARTRYKKEVVEYEAKQEKRARNEAETGKKARGKVPKPPEAGPKIKIRSTSPTNNRVSCLVAAVVLSKATMPKPASILTVV
jgi:hypothetical protein